MITVAPFNIHQFLVTSWDSGRMRLGRFLFSQVLGIEEYAPLDEVNRAYKRLSLVYHPDKTKGMTQQQQVRVIRVAWGGLGRRICFILEKTFRAGAAGDSYVICLPR